MITAADLIGQPTLGVGQTGDLKVDQFGVRVWVERTEVEDGEQFDCALVVETMDSGRWVVSPSSPQRYLTTGTRADRAARKQIAFNEVRAKVEPMSKAEIMKLAQSLSLPAWNRLRKSELIEAVLPHFVDARRVGVLDI